jgi:hypothetical protein
MHSAIHLFARHFQLDYDIDVAEDNAVARYGCTARFVSASRYPPEVSRTGSWPSDS